MDATLARLGRDLFRSPLWHSPAPLVAPPVECPAPRQDMLWKVRPALSDRGRIPGTSDATWCSLAKCRGTTGRLWVGLGGNWKQMKTLISCNVLQIQSRNILTIFAWHLLTLSRGCKQLPKMLDEVEVMAGFTTLGT